MLSYLYHASVYWTFQTVLNIIIYIAPTSLVQDQVIANLEAWGIGVLVDGQSEKTTKSLSSSKANQCTLTVHDRRFFKKVAVNGSLAFGEAYMNGLFDSSDLCTQCRILGGKKPPSQDSFIFRCQFYLKNSLVTARNLQTKGVKSMKVIDLHYNLGNDLYSLMLDERMNYSCAYWKDVEGDDLNQAQINKMDLIARKLKLKPGMRVLDIGSGFGSTAKYLAQNYGVSVVGYNISKEQLKYARESCEGLSVEFVEDDYRNAAKSGKFDAVYSVGFFEHVGRNNYREYFELVESCLKDDGLHLVHSITLRDASLPRTEDWGNKYIFPGGELPDPQDYFSCAEGLLAVEDVHCFGPSYAKTLRMWKKNFIENWPKLETKYGPMVDGKFYRMWIYYLDVSIGSFEGRTLQLYQVVHSKQGCKSGVECCAYDSVR